MSGSTTQDRIDAQLALVSSLVPGSEHHRLAVKVLLLLQDSLHVLHEAEVLLRAARRQTAVAET